MSFMKTIKEKGEKELKDVGIKKPTGLASYTVGAISTAASKVPKYTPPTRHAPSRHAIFKKHVAMPVRAKPGLKGFMLRQPLPTVQKPELPKKKQRNVFEEMMLP